MQQTKKYKLINLSTNEETICDEVTIDGFQYYVSDGEPFAFAYIKHKNEVIKVNRIGETSGAVYHDKGFNYSHECQKVVATNNSNIDIPMVIDPVQVFAETQVPDGFRTIWKSGYNKSQKTHPFSEEDLIDFAEFCHCSSWDKYDTGFYSTKELLQFWKEKNPMTLYYQN